MPNLPAGTILTSTSPQQGSGSGTYVIGNNGVAGDSGVGSLFGFIGRNTYHGPREQRFDLSLAKAFSVHGILGEKGNIQIRAEAFKILNNAIFSNPASNISNSTLATSRLLWMAPEEFYNWR